MVSEKLVQENLSHGRKGAARFEGPPSMAEGQIIGLTDSSHT